MSELLRVERLEIARWGRASGFSFDLSPCNLVVLYGPNESGKSSVATALAWLIAGPATQEVLQRFGTNKDVLHARLRGLLGSDPLSVEVSTRVTAQPPGAVAREVVEASVGGTSVSREELSRRLGSGDFAGYQRLYWVEALKVADGSDLQENVSVQAVFGGINPFAEAKGLSARALKYIGAAKARAREGSSRELHDRARGLDVRLRELPDTKAEWDGIEKKLAVKHRKLKQLQQRIHQMEGELGSVKLAAAAVNDGLVAARDIACQTLTATPEPSLNDRRLYEQAAFVGREIGQLAAGEAQATTRRQQHEEAWDSVDGEWRPLVSGTPIGKEGIRSANDAETRLRLCLEGLVSLEAAASGADTRHESWMARHAGLAEQWSGRAPVALTPEACASNAGGSPESDTSGTHAKGARTFAIGRGAFAGRGGLSALVLGAVCLVVVAAIGALDGSWVTTAVAGTGALALVASILRSARRRSSSVVVADPALVALAKSLLEALQEMENAFKDVTAARSKLAEQHQRTEAARGEYRRELTTLGVSEELAERFQQGVVRRLEAVREAQLAAAGLGREQDAAAVRLDQVRALLTDTAASSGIDMSEDGPDAERATARAAAPTVGVPGEGLELQRPASPIAVRIAAEARGVLDAACERVRLHLGAVATVGDAEDALKLAVQFDDAAVELVEQSSAEALRARLTGLEAELGDLETVQETVRDEIAGLVAARKSVEAPDDQRVDMILKREELLTQVEESLVRGLGHHLAAHLLQEAAERHRTTQQPKLLQRTGEIACVVADDWRTITVNPHISIGGRRSEQGDNLLVDSPRGEYPAGRLSFGAQSLLYLALRLATVEEQCKTRGIRLPVLLDDVLVGLDDERAERCVQVLAEFSVSHQLVLLTCHERTAERAQGVGAEILEMPPR